MYVQTDCSGLFVCVYYPGQGSFAVDLRTFSIHRTAAVSQPKMKRMDNHVNVNK